MRIGFAGVLLATLCASCAGVVVDGSADGPSGRIPQETLPPGVDRESVLANADAFGPIAVRRLSRREYADTIEALTGVQVPQAMIQSFPADSFTPFDNDYENQPISQTLINGVSAIAESVAQTVIADPTLRAGIMPCTPEGAGDGACLRRFVETFGRRVLRRPLTEEEAADFSDTAVAISVAADDFYAGVGVLLRAFLQDVSFLYRIEVGEPVAGVTGLVRLTDYEVASRLAFLLWGRGPDDTLLDAAAAGALDPGEPVRAVASGMLADDRARDRIVRFVAMWLGYDLPLPSPDLDASMRRESAALVERVVFDEQRSWLELFRTGETYVDASLAANYGLPAPDAADGWVPYGADGRGGILSHGSFLSNGVKAGDTSPTLRGLYIRRRLTCEDVPPPPPDLNVNVDEPPPGLSPDACKEERYSAHRTQAACAGCHSQMDPIGFGLENFDARGRYRATEDGRPECAIAGNGELTGIGTFRGPGELAELLITSGDLQACFVRQLHRFVIGRHERPDDQQLLAEVTNHMAGLDHRFDELLLDLVSLPAFRYRRVDDAPVEP